MNRLSLISVLVAAQAVAGGSTLAAAASPSWLELVGPIMSSAEKKAWLADNSAERENFEQAFWANKSISAEEYFKRLEYADATWGGPVRGSGLNTDPGRVYVGLGAPNRVSRFPSSRIFVPIEVWYYDTVPGILNTELRLIFFQPNNTGFPRLYSPTVDTIRALLLNESGTRTLFNQNDILDENTIRQNMNVPPAEDEIISASVNVATGIKYSGNEEILGMVSSPREMLGRAPKTSVESRFIVDRPKMEYLITPSRFGAMQVDFSSDLKAKHEIGIEVLDGQTTVYSNVLRLNGESARAVQYIHRLDLLPGSYRLLIGVDGQKFPYSLEVPARPAMSEIMRAESAHSSANAPFEFDGYRLYPDSDGRYAVVGLSHPSEVQWLIRQGGSIVWRQKTTGDNASVLPLPYDRLPPGHYRLEAEAGDESQVLDFDLNPRSGESAGPSLLSFNVNLSSAARNTQVGHERLLRGQIPEAVTSLNTALNTAPVEQAMVDLARIDALAGRLDEARHRVQAILAADPASFEALCVYASVEVGFEDYRAAAQLYQRALAIEDSPPIRLALARLPKP